MQIQQTEVVRYTHRDRYALRRTLWQLGHILACTSVSMHVFCVLCIIASDLHMSIDAIATVSFEINNDKQPFAPCDA